MSFILYWTIFIFKKKKAPIFFSSSLKQNSQVRRVHGRHAKFVTHLFDEKAFQFAICRISQSNFWPKKALKRCISNCLSSLDDRQIDVRKALKICFENSLIVVREIMTNLALIIVFTGRHIYVDSALSI